MIAKFLKSNFSIIALRNLSKYLAALGLILLCTGLPTTIKAQSGADHQVFLPIIIAPPPPPPPKTVHISNYNIVDHGGKYGSLWYVVGEVFNNRNDIGGIHWNIKAKIYNGSQLIYTDSGPFVMNWLIGPGRTGCFRIPIPNPGTWTHVDLEQQKSDTKIL